MTVREEIDKLAKLLSTLTLINTYPFGSGFLDDKGRNTESVSVRINPQHNILTTLLERLVPITENDLTFEDDDDIGSVKLKEVVEFDYIKEKSWYKDLGPSILLHQLIVKEDKRPIKGLENGIKIRYYVYEDGNTDTDENLCVVIHIKIEKKVKIDIRKIQGLSLLLSVLIGEINKLRREDKHDIEKDQELLIKPILDNDIDWDNIEQNLLLFGLGQRNEDLFRVKKINTNPE